MNDDYLWDGSGSPDTEIQRLERVLARFRSTRPAPEFSQIALAGPGTAEKVSSGWRQPWTRVMRPSPWPRLGVAAASVLMIAGIWFITRHKRFLNPASAGWEVEILAGAPQVGARRVVDTGFLKTGQVLQTDHSSRARINIGNIGQVEVEPNTRLRLIEARDSRDLVALDRGTIEASIWALPGQFVVDTPSAVAVDLGCAYTLSVDDAGSGLLRTTIGWVGFKLDGRESFIPAGAVCATKLGVGPGTPYFDDASPSFRAALARLDFDRCSAGVRDTELQIILAQARQRDALTLWHLLSRLNGAERARVYDRLAALVPPPRGVTRAGALSGDRQMLDLWWNALDLGDISLWRTFERTLPDKPVHQGKER